MRNEYEYMYEYGEYERVSVYEHNMSVYGLCELLALYIQETAATNHALLPSPSSPSLPLPLPLLPLFFLFFLLFFLSSSLLSSSSFTLFHHSPRSLGPHALELVSRSKNAVAYIQRRRRDRPTTHRRTETEEEIKSRRTEY
jgi:hypothetical protein